MTESVVTMSSGSSQLQTGEKFLRTLPDENDGKIKKLDHGAASDIVPDGHSTLEELLVGLAILATSGLCSCILSKS